MMKLHQNQRLRLGRRLLSALLSVLFIAGMIPYGVISINAEDGVTVVDVSSFSELTSNNKENYVLNITDDIVFTSRLTPANGLVINGNGHTFSISVPALTDEGILNQSPSTYGMFYINVGRTNVINDVRIKGGNGWNVENRGTLTMNKVSITNCQYKPFHSNGISILKDCDISRNYVNSGGAVYADGGSMVLDGCSVTQNRITSWGAIGANNTNVYINNTTVANNHSTDVGGLLFRGSSGNRKTVCVMNSTIAGNYSTGGWGAFSAGNYADVYGVNNVIQDNFCSRYPARNNTYIESANATLTLTDCLTTESTTAQPSGSFYKYTTFGNVDTAGLETTYSWPHVLLLENSDGVKYAPLSAGSDALSGGVKTYFDYTLGDSALSVNMSHDNEGVNTPLGDLTASETQVTKYTEGTARADGVIGASGTGSGDYYIARLSGGTNSNNNKLKYVQASGISVYGDVYRAGDTPSVVLDPTGYVVNGLENLTEDTDYRDLSDPGDGDVKTYEIIGNSDTIIVPDYAVIPDVTAITYPVTVEESDEYTGNYTLTTGNFTSGDLFAYDTNANITITTNEGYCVAGFEGVSDSTYTSSYTSGTTSFSFNIREATVIKPIIAKLDDINNSDKLYGAAKYKNVTLEITSDITVDQAVALSDGVVINGNGHTVKVPVTGLNDMGIVNENASDWSVFTLQKTQIGVNLNDMTIEGGSARAISSTTGGARNRLSMQNVKVAKVNFDYAIYSEDVNLEFKNCVFTLNRCSEYVVRKRGTTAVVEGCSFIKNYGGAYKIETGTDYINNTVFAGNFDTHGSYYSQALVSISSNTALYMSNVSIIGNHTDRSLYVGWSNWSSRAYCVNCVFADNYSADRNNKMFPSSIRIANENASGEFYNCFATDVFSSHQNASLTVTNCNTNAEELTTAYGYRSYNRIIAEDGTPSGIRLPFAIVLTENLPIPYAPLSPDSGALSGGVKTYFDYTVSGRDITARMSYDSGGTNTTLGLQTETSENEVTSYVEGGERASGVIGCSGVGEGEYYTVKVDGPVSCDVRGATVFGDAYAVDSPNHVSIAPLDNGGNVSLEFMRENKVITGFRDIDEVLYTTSGNTYTFTPDQSMDVIPLFEGDMSDVDTYEKLRDYARIPGAVLNLTSDIEIEGLITVAENVTINGNGYTVRVPVTGLDDAGTVNDTPSAYGVFYVPAGNSLKLNHMTVEGGATTAITSAGVLIMDDVTVQKAYLTVANALGSISGGGLYCTYITILTNCSIRRNVAAYSNQSGGGGIASGNGADIVMDNCSVTENTARAGGGGYSGSQPIHINNTLFANNRAANNGAFSSQFPDLMNCTFVGNSSINNSEAIWTRGISAVNCVFADNVVSSYASDTVKPNTDVVFAKNWGDSDLLVNCAYGGVVNADARTTEINTKNITPGNTLLSYFDNISRDYNHLDGKEGKGHYPHASLLKTDGGQMYYSPVSPSADVMTGGTKTYFEYGIKGASLTVKMSYMDDEGNIIAFAGNTAADASAEVKTYLEGSERQDGVIGASGAGSGTYHTIRLTGGRYPLGDFEGASIFGETYTSGSNVSVYETVNSGADLRFKDANDEGSYLNPVRNPDNTYTFTMDRDYAVIPTTTESYNITNYSQLAEYGALPNAVLNIMNDITVSDAVALADGVIINGNGYTVSVRTTGLDDIGAVNSDASNHGVFTVAPNNSVEIYNLDIYGGSVSAVCNQGILLMENVDISKSYAGNNNAAGNTQGGAIYSNKTLILKNCDLSLNASWSNGGAVSAGGMMSAENCSFTDNRTLGYNTGGGAVYKWNSSGTNALYLSNCAVVDNTAAGSGGGIYNGMSEAYLANCTIAGNAGTTNNGQGFCNANNYSTHIVNTIIADNFYVNNTTRNARDLSGGTINLYNCVYGYAVHTLRTESNCKTAEYSQENGSSGIFADYRTAGILNSAAVETYKAYPHPVLDETLSGLMFAPLDAGSLPMTGGTKTYYSFSQSTLTARMSYDADGTNTALGNLSASSSPNENYLEGGARDYGVIGTSTEVDIYYKPRASLTIKQSIDGELESGVLAEVTITNVNGSAPPSPYSAYADEDNQALDSIVLTDTRTNVIEHDENVPGALSRTTKLGMHKGVQPQIKIEPHGDRNISSVKIQKKTGKVYTDVSASSYTITGTFESDGYVIYTFNNGVNIGDDYVVRIVYGSGKTFTVKTVMLDAEGNENDVDTLSEFNVSKATVTVNAERYDADGNAIPGEYAFTDKTVVPNVDENGFTVTSKPVRVYSATNTRVTVSTAIGEGSEYVIANVKAVRDSGDDLHLVTPRTVASEGNIGTSYDECTLSSLASTDNVTLIVYLAKMVSYNVSVYNISATGEIINGVPSGSDAYVNVNVRSNDINDRAIITDQSEGGYYTGSFDITINPHSRHVSVIEGTKLDIFAQLPGNGDYVIRKVTGTGYSNVNVSNISFGSGNLHETLSTGEEAISSDKTYDVKIYIEHAQSIITRAVDVNGSAVSAATGTVKVNGSHSETGVIPFTKIRPAAGNTDNTREYNAVYTGSGYTTEVKCARGTDITFEVKPQSHYNVKTLTVKKGAAKDAATDVSFTLTGTAEDGTMVYQINEPMPYSNNIYIDVEFEPDPDLLTVYNKISGYGNSNVKSYLFYVSDPEDIDFSADESTFDELGSVNRYGAEMKEKTSAYYVLSTALSREELQILGARYSEISDNDEGTDILSALCDSYTTRYNEKGQLRYIYYYRVNVSDAHPIDNDVWFNVIVSQITHYDPVDGNPDCNITVEQWNRETYDGQYVAADNQSARFSVPSDKVLRRNSKTGAAANPITVSSSLGYMYSEKKTVLTITPMPAEGYNVEKVIIYQNGVNTQINGYNGVYRYTLGKDPTMVKIYYSRPMLIISSTNEGNEGKATVNVGSEMVLNRNTFINGTFVTKNENAVVTINPLTYDDDGITKYYKVASIRIGDAFNNTLTAYTDAEGDVENDGYTVIKNTSGSEYTLTLNNVQKDKYIFIQLVGKENLYKSNLQVNQKIKLAGSDDYIDCTDSYFGSVTVNGSLIGYEDPLNFGSDVSSFTFNDTASVTGTVLKDTLISLQASAPSGYMVQSVEAEMNGENITVTKNDDTYALLNKAPDSGSTVITVKYALNAVPYTLNYHYNGVSGGNGSSYTGDDAQEDPKVYTVSAELYPSEIYGGKPTVKAITDRAPAVDDLYKDCKWVIDLNDESKVKFSANNVVDIYAVQPPKNYTVKFFYSGSEQEDKVVRAPLNSLVRENDEFIEAPGQDGSGNEFVYWSVVQNGQEIARCSSRAFNLRVTGDMTVTAMYNVEVTNFLSVSDPALSRQKYTENGKDVDKLYADFILSYMDSNGLLLKEQPDGEYQTGLVVEFFGDKKLDKADTPGGKLTDEDKASVVLPDASASRENIEALVNGNTNSAINGNQALYKYTVPHNSSYSNKNRVDRSVSFNNTEYFRHYVFRAYYYVKHGDTVELSQPVTFYLYDIGNSQTNVEEG